MVTSGAGPAKVVGLLFGGGEDTKGLATPIEDVVGAFPELALSFALAAGQDPDAIKTVPASAITSRPSTALLRPTRFTPISLIAFWGNWGNRFAAAQDEVAATIAGRDYADVVRRTSFPKRRRLTMAMTIGAVWQRSSRLPEEIMNALLEMVCRRDSGSTTEIHGTPLADCLAHSEGADTIRESSVLEGPRSLHAIDRQVVRQDVSGTAGQLFQTAQSD